MATKFDSGCWRYSSALLILPCTVASQGLPSSLVRHSCEEGTSVLPLHGFMARNLSIKRLILFMR